MALSEGLCFVAAGDAHESSARQQSDGATAGRPCPTITARYPGGERPSSRREWTLRLCDLVHAALTGPLAALLTPLAHASSLVLNVVAAILAAALIGAYVALAVLLILAVLHVVRPRLDGRR